MPQSDYYVVNGAQLTRVTKVIGFCERINEQANFIAWRQKVGEEEADRIVRRASSVGTKAHSLFETYYTDATKHTQLVSKFNAAMMSEVSSAKPKDSLHKDVLKCWQSCTQFLRYYHSALNEERVHYVGSNGQGFCGTADSFGYLNQDALFLDKECTRSAGIAGRKLVIDLKNKSKHTYAKDNYLIKYCLQLGAYSLARNAMFPDRVPVTEALIAIASPRQINVHHVDEGKLKFYQSEFLNCVDYYYRNDRTYSWEELELRCGYRWDERLNRPQFEKDHKLPVRVYLPGVVEEAAE